jgi:hypothetical protein
MSYLKYRTRLFQSKLPDRAKNLDESTFPEVYRRNNGTFFTKHDRGIPPFLTGSIRTGPSRISGKGVFVQGKLTFCENLVSDDHGKLLQHSGDLLAAYTGDKYAARVWARDPHNVFELNEPTHKFILCYIRSRELVSLVNSSCVLDGCDKKRHVRKCLDRQCCFLDFNGVLYAQEFQTGFFAGQELLYQYNFWDWVCVFPCNLTRFFGEILNSFVFVALKLPDTHPTFSVFSHC